MRYEVTYTKASGEKITYTVNTTQPGYAVFDIEKAKLPEAEGKTLYVMRK